MSNWSFLRQRSWSSVSLFAGQMRIYTTIHFRLKSKIGHFVYGSECWLIAKDNERCLALMEAKMLHYVSGVTSQDYIRNENFYIFLVILNANSCSHGDIHLSSFFEEVLCFLVLPWVLHSIFNRFSHVSSFIHILGSNPGCLVLFLSESHNIWNIFALLWSPIHSAHVLK